MFHSNGWCVLVWVTCFTQTSLHLLKAVLNDWTTSLKIKFSFQNPEAAIHNPKSKIVQSVCQSQGSQHCCSLYVLKDNQQQHITNICFLLNTNSYEIMLKFTCIKSHLIMKSYHLLKLKSYSIHNPAPPPAPLWGWTYYWNRIPSYCHIEFHIHFAFNFHVPLRLTSP